MMLSPTLTSIQNQRIILQETGDRFIPQRLHLTKDSFKIAKLLETVEEEDILKQDISNLSLYEYRQHLKSSLNFNKMYSRVLRFSSLSLPHEAPFQKNHQWPIKCRRRPLIKQPHHLLDLPSFRSNFCFNLLDWGPSNYLVAALNKTVYLYEIGREPFRLTAFIRAYCSAVKWNFSGDKVAIGTSDSEIQVWSTNKRKLLQEHTCDCTFDDCMINAIAWHTGDSMHVSGCSSGTLQLMSMYPGKERTYVPVAHYGPIISLRCSPDGRFLASSGDDSAVRLWFWSGLIPGFEIISDNDDPIRAIAWHPWKPSYFVFGGSMSGSISLWNVNNGTQLAYKKLGTPASVCSLEWSPISGELVAGVWIPGSSNADNSMGTSLVIVLESLNKVVDRMECCIGRVNYLLWSPDGKEIMTTGSDETIRIWYFFGPSSATQKDKGLQKYLKPVVPSDFSSSFCFKTEKCSLRNKRKTSTKEIQITDENNFGCVIR